MAVTQYIGARYVPKFFTNSQGTEEWQSGVEYEPLTIVTYNSNSYTSKVPVPANIGNPSANPDYWVATGIYNAQVELLRQEVETLQGDVNTQGGEIDALQAESEIMKDSRTGRKFVLIGDSYGMRYNTNWRNYFAAAVGSDCLYSDARSSYGFLPNGMQFIAILESAIAALTTAERATVTDIVVVGGWNDARALKQGATNAALQTAIRAFCTRAAEAFPNAVITLEYCGWQTGHGVQDNLVASNFYSARQVYDGTYAPNLKHGLSAFNVMLDCNNLDSSGFHPSEAAATPLYFAIMCDVVGVSYTYISNYNTRGGWTAANTGTLATHEVAVNNGIARFRIAITGITGATSGGSIGTINALDFLPFPLWNYFAFQGYIMSTGAAVYCYLNGSDGAFKVFGQIPAGSFDLYAEVTMPLS